MRGGRGRVIIKEHDCCELTARQSLRGAHCSHMRLMSSFSAPNFSAHSRTKKRERELVVSAERGWFSLPPSPAASSSNSTVSKQLCLSQFPVADIPSSLTLLLPSSDSSLPPFLPSLSFSSSDCRRCRHRHRSTRGFIFQYGFPPSATVVRPTKRYVNFQSSLDGRSQMRHREGGGRQ